MVAQIKTSASSTWVVCTVGLRAAATVGAAHRGKSITNRECRSEAAVFTGTAHQQCVYKFMWAGRASFIEIATYFEAMAPDHYMQARPIEPS